jgi:chloramphenicol O-acetyltransferase type B
LSPKSADVTIGDYVWIGAGSYIGPGIVIGDGAIVGANSVVHRAVEPNEIVGGSPLRHIRFKRSAQSEASEEN